MISQTPSTSAPARPAAGATKNKAPRFSSLAEIRADEVLPLPLFQSRTGLGGWAYRKAVKDGLKTAKIGRNVFVRGSAWLEYCQQREQ